MTDSHEAGGADMRALVQPLDGPPVLSFRRSTPPEPIGTRHLVVTAETFDGSDSMVLVDREDSPVWPDEPDDSAEPDAQAPQDAVTRTEDGSEPTPSAVTPSGRSCEQCGRALGSWRRDDARFCSGACRVAAHRARRGTPALYPSEVGR